MAVNLEQMLCNAGCGIPYSITGALTLEQKYIILANAFIGFEKDISDHLTSWFDEWVKENLDGVFGDIMYEQDTETVIFSVEPLIGCASHSVRNEQLIIDGGENSGKR